MTEQNGYEFRPNRIRLSLKTDYIFFPIDSNDFSKAIRGYDYEVKSSPQTLGPIRIEVPGHLAEKEGNNVVLDTNRQIFAVDGDNPEKILEVFEELEEVIRNDLMIDLSESIKFYEIIIDYFIFSRNNPREVIENIFEDFTLAETFSSIVGEVVVPYTLRYASKGSPDSSHWMDIKIEPFVRRATQVYAFNLIFRSVSGDEVKQTLQSINEIMEKIVIELET